jgi:hypothetical protein
MNDLFSTLNTAHVRYLLVGGQAMRLYGMPRFFLFPTYKFSVARCLFFERTNSST